MPRIDSKQFYLSSINKYGHTPKGVNWASKATQELRFKIISNMLPENIDRLVDAGCGFGDFYYFLQEQDITLAKYIGIDSIHKMCSIASKYTKQEIIFSDITKGTLPPAEYYVCSGAMNVLNTFETHLFIRNCFESCSKAFIFNILYGDTKSSTYNYLSKEDIQKIAKDLQVKQVSIHDDYMKNDITVGFFH